MIKVLGLAAAAALMMMAAAPTAAQAQAASASCAPAGGLQFVCGVKGVEDLVQVPGTRWMIASNMDVGPMRLVDSRAKTWSDLYPAPGAADRWDRETYADCPGPPDKTSFKPHGLDAVAAGPGRARLYVVNHGGREAIEVFDIRGAAHPRAIWIGCVVEPPTAVGNSVAGLPGGGFVFSSFVDKGASMAQMFKGQPVGHLYVWRPGTGFTTAPDAHLAGDNGVVVSPDGKTAYLAVTGARQVLAFALTAGAAAARVAPLDFAPDNLRWTADGRILVAGQTTPDCPPGQAPPAGKACPNGFAVAAVTPSTMTVKPLARGPAWPGFSGISSALQMERTLWIAGFGADRLAYEPAP